MDGSSLETALKAAAGSEAPVRLLDARYLIELAANDCVLPRRQDIPERAFIDLPRMKIMTSSGLGSLRIISVSAPWLTEHEPDPRGDHLRALAEALELFVNDSIFGFPGTPHPPP